MHRVDTTAQLELMAHELRQGNTVPKITAPAKVGNERVQSPITEPPIKQIFIGALDLAWCELGASRSLLLRDSGMNGVSEHEH
jgi:hypothetical protein